MKVQFNEAMQVASNKGHQHLAELVELMAALAKLRQRALE
jgi:hypothetical protein